MVATEAEKAGFQVKMFDGLWDKPFVSNTNNDTRLLDVLNDFQPDIIGVSIRNIDDVVMEHSTYYVDDVEVLSATDSTYTSGYGGFVSRANDCSTLQIDDWSGE